MTETALKRYIFASDFDQTLSFNDSGYVLSEMLGIPADEFERKAVGMARLNLVQQGAELAYLLLHDPEFHSRVRKEHLYEAGKKIRLKNDIELLFETLAAIDSRHFDSYVLSAAPVEVIRSALEGIVPPDHIFGTEFAYNPSGEIDRIVRAVAGYGKVAVLHVNARDGFTIAVSESKHVAQIAKRTVLSSNALAVIVPILEVVLGWNRASIREFFES